MVNFYDETIKAIENYGYDISDISWIGDYGVRIKPDLFFDMAKKMNILESGNGPHINMELLIVFRDGNWLSRKECTGPIWWEYNYIPIKPYAIIDRPELIDPDFLEWHLSCC